MKVEREVHLIKFKFRVDQIKLGVKFPGQLSFQLKNDIIYQNLVNLYPLINGVCKINQTIEFQAEGNYDLKTSQYDQLLIDLIISITSTTGKITVGVVNLNLYETGLKSLPLKKCSDKTAEAKFSVTFQFLQKIKDIHILEENVNEHESKMVKDLKLNLVRFQNKKDDPISEPQQSSIQSRQSRDKSSDSKIKFLLQSRANNNDKSRVATKRETSYQEMVVERKVQLLKEDNKNYQIDIEKLKEKIKILQKKDRESQYSAREIKDQLEKKKNKIIQLETKLNQAQISLQDKNKSLKNLQIQYKQVTEELSNAQFKCTNFQKKLQLKQEFFIEKEKKLLEKLYSNQRQITKISHQYNLTLEKMEIQEKFNLSTNKDKEKIYSEQKGKLRDSLEQLNKSMIKIKEQKDEMESKLILAGQEISILSAKATQFENANSVLICELQIIKMSLNIERDQKKELEKDIEYLKNADEDKNSLKKKGLEQMQEIARLKDKNQKYQVENKDFKDKKYQLEAFLEEIKKEKRVLTNKTTENQKRILQLLKENQAFEASSAALSSKNTYLNERNNDLKTKLQQLEQQKIQKEHYLQDQINSLIKSKEYLNNQIEDFRQIIEKHIILLDESQKKLKAKTNQFLDLQEMNLKKDERINNLEYKIEELQLQKVGSDASIEQNKVREKELVQNLKSKEKLIYELNKKIQQIEQEEFLSKTKLVKVVQESTQSKQTDVNKIKQMKQEIASLNEQTIELQVEIDLKDQQILNIENQNKDKRHKLQLTEQELHSTKQLFDSLQKQSIQTALDLKQTNILLQSTRKQLESVKENLKTCEESLKKQNEDWKGSYKAFSEALKQLLMLLSKDDNEEQNKKLEVKAFPDEYLNNLQIEALNERNKLLSKYHKQFKELQDMNSYLEMKIEILEAQFEEKNVLAQKQIQHMITKYENILKGKQDEKIQQQKISERYLVELEGGKQQNEKLQNNVENLEEQIAELNAKIFILTEESNDLTEEKQALESIIISLRKEGISAKHQEENHFDSIVKEKDLQIQNHTQNIKLLQANLQLHQTNLLQIQKHLDAQKKNHQILKVSKEELQKHQKQLIEALFTQSTINKKLEISIIEKQQQCEELEFKLESVEKKFQNERKTKNEIEIKITEYYQQNSELKVENEKLRSQMKQIIESNQKKRIEQQEEIDNHLQIELRESNINKDLKQKLHEVNSALELKEFLFAQNQKKLQELNQRLSKATLELKDKRQSIFSLQNQIEVLKKDIIYSGKNKETVEHEKSELFNSYELKKKQIQELNTQNIALRAKIDFLTNQFSRSNSLNHEVQNQNSKLENLIKELKEVIQENKKQIIKSASRQNQLRVTVKQLEKALEEKQEFYEQHQSKNWEENERELNKISKKFKEAEKKWEELKTQSEEEIEHLVEEIENLKNINIELEQLLETKEEFVQDQDDKLIENQNKIISLNSEIKNCLEAWEREKASAKASRKVAAEIQEELLKFQSYAADVNSNTQQLMEIAKKKLIEETRADTLKSLGDIDQLILRSKSRAVSSASEEEKQLIVLEYEQIQQKLKSAVNFRR